MAIFGFGASYGGVDVSSDFVHAGVVGIGYDYAEAPDLHEMIKTIDVGDVVYIKAANCCSDITVKAIGIVVDSKNVTNSLITTGKKVNWVYTSHVVVAKPANSKNNVYSNAVYQEFHPDIAARIIKLMSAASLVKDYANM